MSTFYQDIVDTLSNNVYLSFKAEYYKPGDSLDLRGYSHDGTQRVQITVQNSEVPEFDISFGNDINYYSSLGSQDSAFNYLDKLMGDIALLSKSGWVVTLGEVVLTKKKYIIPKEGAFSVLKRPPKLFLKKLHNQEMIYNKPFIT